MKKLSLIVFLLFLSAQIAISQCNPYYDFDDGTLIEMTNYDRKDRDEGKIVNEVVSYQKTGNGFVAVLNSKIYDKKDKMVNEGEYEILCEDGIIKIDMSKYLPQESLKMFENMEMETSGEMLTIPSQLSVGQELNDGFVKVEAKGDNSLTNTSMEMKFINRKVEAKEQLTTPAGTFDCLKIRYDMEGKTKMMGMGVPMNFSAVEWISEDVGVVKSESYNKNGKLIGYSLLTRYE